MDSAVTKKVVGISVGTTGSTVCPVDRKGVALALIPEFAEDPDAMFHLWKDHTAVAEAKEITSAFSTGDVDYTKFQGEYSAEWFWAKILHTTRKNSKVKNSAYNWVEQCDWIAGVLNLPIMVSGERQGCALGACIYAAVGAGVYSTIQEAQKQFCEPYSAKFFPKENMHAKYMLEYDKYLSLGEYVEYHVSE